MAAANDFESFDNYNKPIEDTTTCCICNEVNMDPIVFPCSHIFCTKCFHDSEVEFNKSQGDEVPCPICRRMFKVLPEELHGLPQNIFIEKLTQVTNLPCQSPSLTPMCDACSEENQDADQKVPAADTYCVDCNQKFCPECSRQHRRFKSTKNHCFLPINDHEGGQFVVTDQAPGICEMHKLHILNIYCTDCKIVVCAMCFIDDHGNHKGSHVNKVVADFRRQIESNVEAINECRSKAEAQKAELVKVKDDLQERVKNIECEVNTRKDELKQFVDQHATSLLQGVYSKRQSKLKEIEISTDDIDTYLSSLETYHSYYEKILGNGSANDICCAFSDLSARAVELLQQYQPMIEREFHSFNFCFQKSGLEEFLEENCDNMIGSIEEEGDPKTRRRINQSLLSQQSNEIERLRKEIQCEIADRESLRLVIVQLRINMNKEVQASHKVFTEELSKEKAYNDAHIMKLRETLDNNKITCSTLQAENNQLKQKLDIMIATIKSLQDQNDKLRHELGKEKNINNFVQASDNGFVQEVNDTRKATFRALEDDGKELKRELEIKKIVELPYTSDPVLIQTIRTKASAARKKLISGLTILDNEFFVVSNKVSEVEVYDLMSLRFKHQFHLKELINPKDIGSCSRNKCVYIVNDIEIQEPKQILRVDPSGNLVKNWSTEGERGWGLSVTNETNIILSSYGKPYLIEYSSDGILIRKIRLSVDSVVYLPLHAIKLTNGHFMVSRGLDRKTHDDPHSVCIVNGDGKLVKSVGTGWTMRLPAHLSVDGNGFVLVADRVNGRVLLFDSDLQFRKEILSKVKHGSQYPWRILLDEANGRLFVAVTNSRHGDDGQILVFDMK